MMWNFHNLNIFYLGFFALVIIAILVANDANSTGRNGLFWGLITLLMPMMGLIIYLVVRSYPVTPVTQSTYSTPPSRPVRAVQYQPVVTQTSGGVQYCTSCGASNKLEAKFCNTCGEQIKE